MDKSQYQPPRTEYSADLYRQIEQSTIDDTPERLTAAPFQLVKDIENLVDSFRDTAEAIEQANGHEVTFKFLPISFIRPARSHEDILKELIDNESVIGGRLFAEKNKYKFWYGEKSNTSARDKDIADWYIEEIIPNNPGSGVITHIETHPQYIKKFNHNGQLVPVSLSDLEIFIPAVYHYVHAIMEIYPFEQNRAEVILDGLTLPNDVSALLPPEHNAGHKSDYGLAA